ncbi:hypothetical protein HG536_0D02670 [Torulaspora globosa]|uniref:Meiotic nuclear division protein 1 n=1 Tax=Torulaspora globosa TaxID=48254 RepID=A0A7G3ZGV9_9SACH|nr:uncharacterized protein HG536_0D02670 [Torulaspora globosa]QLL32745.1 hypothetical protein HG536_0D02670 [Torulaspora globosa]
MKELEKLIPKKCAGVSPMLVKDLVQQMIDEDGLICVEKCGNINVYWCFKNQIIQKVYDSCERLKGQIEAKEKETVQLKENLRSTCNGDRKELFKSKDGKTQLSRQEQLKLNREIEESIKNLQSEYNRLSQTRWDKKKIDEKKKALDQSLRKLEVITDNIDIIIDYFRAKYGVESKSIRQELEIPEDFPQIET